jgi:hypothetical protein
LADNLFLRDFAIFRPVIHTPSTAAPEHSLLSLLTGVIF